VLILITHTVRSQTGILDVTFGNNGTVVRNLQDSGLYSQDMVLQPDGKILVLVQSSYKSMGDSNYNNIFRFHANGKVDSTFNGIGYTRRIYNNTAKKVALQPDGKILLVVQQWSLNPRPGLLVERYNSNGKVDSSFGQNGIVITGFFNTGDHRVFPEALFVKPNGKIVLGGYSTSYNTGALIMLLPNYIQMAV
jgi:uncharacterized delta-60 repeat protein